MKTLHIIISAFFILILFVLLGCDHKLATLPLTSRPAGWISMGLAGREVGRLRIFDNELYVCAGRHGLFRSPLPEEREWEYLGLADTSANHFELRGVTDIVALADTLIVSYEANFRLQKAGIYRSVDKGANWQPSVNGIILTPLDTTFSSAMLVLAQSAQNPLILLVGTNVGEIFLSRNFGLNWQHVFGFLGGSALVFAGVRFHPSRPSDAWAGGQVNTEYPYLIRSSDSGENWETILNQSPAGEYTLDGVESIAFDTMNNGIVYLAMERLWKSVDYGKTWAVFLDSADAYWSLEVNPRNGDEIIASGAHFLYHTTDGGKNWSLTAPPPDAGFLYYLTVDWRERILYTSTYTPGGGVYKLYF